MKHRKYKSYCEPLNQDIVFQWGDVNLGFGHLMLFKRNGITFIDTENMGKEFMKQKICEMIDNAEEV